jgi:hypothetical protein
MQIIWNYILKYSLSQQIGSCIDAIRLYMTLINKLSDSLQRFYITEFAVAYIWQLTQNYLPQIHDNFMASSQFNLDNKVC